MKWSRVFELYTPNISIYLSLSLARYTRSLSSYLTSVYLASTTQVSRV